MKCWRSVDLQSLSLRPDWRPLGLAFFIGALLGATLHIAPRMVAEDNDQPIPPEALSVCEKGSTDSHTRLEVLASAEARSLCESPRVAKLLKDYETKHGVDINITYVGGNELAAAVKAGDGQYDAYLVPDPVVAKIGDKTGNALKDQKVIPIGKTPIVLAVRGQELRDKLGVWGNRISPRKLVRATTDNVLNPAMSPPTQIGSGTWVFDGIVDSLDVGNKLSKEGKAKIERFFRQVSSNRTSSAEIAESLAADPTAADSFIGTEGDVIRLNQTLISRKVRSEELYRVLYVEDTYAPTLSLVVPKEETPATPQTPKGEAPAKVSTSTAIVHLEKTVESHEFRKEIVRIGIRPEKTTFEKIAGYVEPLPQGGSSDLGFDSNVPVETEEPEAKEVEETVETYQEVRPPSIIVIGADYSGSMKHAEPRMEEALKAILDPQQASELFLAIKEEDVRSVLPFSTKLRAVYRAVGPQQSGEMVTSIIREQSALGETAFYQTVVDAHVKLHEELQKLGESRGDYKTVIVAMTDGKDTRKGTPEQVIEVRRRLGLDDVLLVQIAFGEADVTAMQKLAKDTNGVFCVGDMKTLKSCFVQGVGSGS